MDIERFSDLIKPRTSTTRDSIDQILQLTANNFPQELIKGWKSMICKNIVVFIRIILEIHLMVQWNFRFKGTTEHKKSAMEYRCRFDEIKSVSSISFSFLFILFCFKKVYLYVICPIHLYWLGMARIEIWNFLLCKSHLIYHTSCIHGRIDIENQLIVVVILCLNC